MEGIGTTLSDGETASWREPLHSAPR